MYIRNRNIYIYLLCLNSDIKKSTVMRYVFYMYKFKKNIAFNVID